MPIIFPKGDINTEELMYLFSASELEDYIVSEMYTELK